MKTIINPIEAMNAGQKVTYIYTCCRPNEKRYGEKRIAWCVNPEAKPQSRRYTAKGEDGNEFYPQTAEGFTLAMIGWNEQL